MIAIVVERQTIEVGGAWPPSKNAKCVMHCVVGAGGGAVKGHCRKSGRMGSGARSMLELNISIASVYQRDVYGTGPKVRRTADKWQGAERGRKGSEMMSNELRVYPQSSSNLQQKEFLEADQILTSGARGKYEF